MESSKPVLVKPLKHHSVRKGHEISIDMKYRFKSSDGNLWFSLGKDTPKWLNIDRKTGVITGKAPTLEKTTNYPVIVRVANQYGAAINRFTLKVVAEDFMSLVTHALTMPQHKDLTSVELLAILFEYLMSLDCHDELMKLVKEEADRHKIKIGDKLTYDDFAKVVRKSNPKVDAKLVESVNKDYISVLESINQNELRNLYRQGSQQQGVVPIPVWNYLAAPDFCDWSYTGNVLDSAAEKVMKMRYQSRIGGTKQVKAAKYLGLLNKTKK